MSARVLLVWLMLALTAPSVLATSLAEWEQSGQAAMDENDPGEARRLWRRGLDLARVQSDASMIAEFLALTGLAEEALGRFNHAENRLQQALQQHRQLADKVGEALDSRALGRIALRLDNLPRARGAYRRAIRLHRESGDLANLAVDYTEQAHFFEAVGEPRAAMKAYREALVVTRALADPAREATILMDLARLDLAENQPDEALLHFQQALALHERLGHHEARGLTLARAARIYRDQGNIPKAIRYFRLALAVFKELGDRQGEVDALVALGDIFRARGEPAKAREQYRDALHRHRWREAEAEEAEVLNRIGQTHGEEGDTLTALSHYRQALALYRKLGAAAGEAESATLIGLAYVARGELEPALPFLLQALPVHREYGDRAAEATVLRQTGAIYLALGQAAQALAHLHNARDAFLANQQPAQAGETLAMIGEIYLASGKNQPAFRYLQQAFRELDALPGQTRAALRVRLRLGRLYQHEDMRKPMFTAYREVLRRAKAAGLERLTIRALFHLAAAHAEQGDHAQALDLAYRAMTLAEAGHEDLRGMTLAVLAGVFQRQDKAAQGIRFARRAVDFFENRQAARDALANRARLADLYRRDEQWERARELLDAALEQARQWGDQPTQWRLLWTLARLERDQRHFTPALRAYREAYELVEAWPAPPPRPLHRFLPGETPRALLDEWLELRARLGQQTEDRSHASRALVIADIRLFHRIRARLRQANVLDFGGVPHAWVEQEDALHTETLLLRERLAALRAAHAPGNSASTLETRLAEAEKMLRALRQRMEREYPDYYALRHAPSWRPVQPRQLLREGEALLRYVVFADHTWVWWMQPRRIQQWRLPLGAEHWRREVTELNPRLREADPPRDALARLAQGLFPHEASASPPKTLYVIPDGPLTALPFAALPAPSQTEAAVPRFLGQVSAVLWQVSLTHLRQQRLRAQKRTITPLRRFLGWSGGSPQWDDLPFPGLDDDDELLPLRWLREHLPPALDPALSQKMIAGLDLDPAGKALRGPHRTSRFALLELRRKRVLDDYQYLLFNVPGILPAHPDSLRQPVMFLGPLTARQAQSGFFPATEVYRLQLQTRLAWFPGFLAQPAVQALPGASLEWTAAWFYAGTQHLGLTLWPANEAMAEVARDLLGELEQERPLGQSWRDTITRHADNPSAWAGLQWFGTDD